MPLCPSCNEDNHIHARYCFNCGTALLPNKKSSFLRLHDDNFSLFAGFHMKGINFAPLITAGLSKPTPSSKDHRYDTPVIYRSDKSWYCPFCGTYNGPFLFSCRGCGRDA